MCDIYHCAAIDGKDLVNYENAVSKTQNASICFFHQTESPKLHQNTGHQVLKRLIQKSTINYIVPESLS